MEENNDHEGHGSHEGEGEDHDGHDHSEFAHGSTPSHSIEKREVHSDQGHEEGEIIHKVR